MATPANAALRADVEAKLEHLLVLALELEARLGGWADAPPRVDALDWSGAAARAHSAASDSLAAKLRSAEDLLAETASVVRVARAALHG